MVAILQTEAVLRLSVVRLVACFVSLGVEGEDRCDPIPEIGTRGLEVQLPSEGIAECHRTPLRSPKVLLPHHQKIPVLIEGIG